MVRGIFIIARFARILEIFPIQGQGKISDLTVNTEKIITRDINLGFD